MKQGNLKPNRQIISDSEERYQAFVQNSQEGIWRFETDPPIPIDLPVDEQIKLMYERDYLAEANDAMARMYGFESAKEMVGDRLDDFLIKDDPKNYEYLKRFVKSGYKLSGVDTHEKDIHGNDRYFRNNMVGIIKDGALVRTWGTQLDVTEQIQTIDKIKESEARFRGMADTAPVLIWLSDTENMGTYFNKTWLDFTGRSLEQELGTGWTESVHPDDLDRAAAYCTTCFNARREFRMEFRLKRADGSYHWVLDHGVPRYSPNGEFLGYIGSCIDIEETKINKMRTSELETINTKLEAQRKQLIELNTSKDEFISLASHQLRTPATSVKQYLGMLSEGYAGDLRPAQLAMLKIAYESNERQLHIIESLLKVAKVDTGAINLKQQKTDLVSFVREIIKEESSKLASKKQDLELVCKDKPISVFVDKHNMHMVIENLIDNASKYSPSGKPVKVIISNTKENATITIADQGVGIAKKDIHRLFKKFSRVDNKLSDLVEGSGLGLYWAKTIVELHGGKIETHSEPDKGTEFSVIIPKKPINVSVKALATN